MKRKLVAMFMAMSLCMLVPITSNAAEVANTSASEASIEPRASKSITVEDWAGNRYKVTGTSISSGITVTVATSFKVTYYPSGNQENVSAYEKECSVDSSIRLQNGKADSLHDSGSEYGMSGEVNASKICSGMISSVTSTHEFSCNGASGTVMSAN